MNILYCSDKSTFSGLEVSLYSLLKHNSNCNVYIFTMDIDVVVERNENNEPYKCKRFFGLSDSEKNKLEKIVKFFGKNNRIKFIDTKEFYDEFFKDTINETSTFTPYAMLRLLCDIILPNVNDILYLDCDTVVTNNIEKYYYDYIKPNENYAAHIVEEACDGKGEMVSGVMLLNLAYIRESKFFEKARKNVVTNEYKFPDQDAMRDADKRGIKFPPTIGFCEDIDDIDYVPYIIHFTNKMTCKIYDYHGADYFYRRYPFLNYIKEGLNIINTINF